MLAAASVKYVNTSPVVEPFVIEAFLRLMVCGAQTGPGLLVTTTGYGTMETTTTTGYISTVIAKFDYKLFPDAAAIEVYLPIERQWVPYYLLGKPLLRVYYNHHFG